ncbi:hypothetical protein MSG28_008135, partial [Choristoneura fumiferana]
VSLANGLSIAAQAPGSGAAILARSESASGVAEGRTAGSAPWRPSVRTTMPSPSRSTRLRSRPLATMCPWTTVAIVFVVLVADADAREISSPDIAALDNHVSSGNRSQRFLFDAIFGLEVPLLEEQSVEDEDDETQVKNCSCGKYSPLFQCGGSNQENRIVGGMPAGANRYPWMARIVYDGQFHCGASLLTKEHRSFRQRRHRGRVGSHIGGRATAGRGARGASAHPLAHTVPRHEVPSLSNHE